MFSIRRSAPIPIDANASRRLKATALFSQTYHISKYIEIKIKFFHFENGKINFRSVEKNNERRGERKAERKKTGDRLGI